MSMAQVEVAGSFYPVPLALLGQRVRVQWDEHLVRVFHDDVLATVHRLVPPGVYAPRPGEAAASSRRPKLCGSPPRSM